MSIQAWAPSICTADPAAFFDAVAIFNLDTLAEVSGEGGGEAAWVELIAMLGA